MFLNVMTSWGITVCKVIFYVKVKLFCPQKDPCSEKKHTHKNNLIHAEIKIPFYNYEPPKKSCLITFSP